MAMMYAASKRLRHHHGRGGTSTVIVCTGIAHGPRQGDGCTPGPAPSPPILVPYITDLDPFKALV